MYLRLGAKKSGQVILEAVIVVVCLALIGVAVASLFSNLNTNLLLRFDVYRKTRVDALNNPARLSQYKMKSDKPKEWTWDLKESATNPVFFLDYFPKTSLGLQETGKLGFAGWLGAFLDDPRIAEAALLIEKEELIEEFILTAKFKQAYYYAKGLEVAESGGGPGEVPHWAFKLQTVGGASEEIPGGVAFIALVKSLVQDIIAENGDANFLGDEADVGLMYQAYNALDRAIKLLWDVMDYPLYYDYPTHKDGPYASAFDENPELNPKLYVDTTSETEGESWQDVKNRMDRQLKEIAAQHKENRDRLRSLIQNQLQEHRRNLYFEESGKKGGLLMLMRVRPGEEIYLRGAEGVAMHTGTIQFWGFERLFNDMGLVSITPMGGFGSTDTSGSGSSSGGPYLLLGGLMRKDASGTERLELNLLDPYTTPPFQQVDFNNLFGGSSLNLTVNAAGDHTSAVSTLDRFARFIEFKDFTTLTQPAEEFDEGAKALTQFDYSKLKDSETIESEYQASIADLAKKYNKTEAEIKQEFQLYGSVKEAFNQASTLGADVQELQMASFLRIMALNQPFVFDGTLKWEIEGLYNILGKDCNDTADIEHYYQRVEQEAAKAINEDLSKLESSGKESASAMVNLAYSIAKDIGSKEELKNAAATLKSNVVSLVEVLMDAQEAKQPLGATELEGLNEEEIKQAKEEKEKERKSLERQARNYIDLCRVYIWALCKVAEATDRVKAVQQRAEQSWWNKADLDSLANSLFRLRCIRCLAGSES